jgi:hypothetical protein
MDISKAAPANSMYELGDQNTNRSFVGLTQDLFVFRRELSELIVFI